jgi:hypothetical protein
VLKMINPLKQYHLLYHHNLYYRIYVFREILNINANFINKFKYLAFLMAINFFYIVEVKVKVSLITFLNT